MPSRTLCEAFSAVCVNAAKFALPAKGAAPFVETLVSALNRISVRRLQEPNAFAPMPYVPFGRVNDVNAVL